MEFRITRFNRHVGCVFYNKWGNTEGPYGIKNKSVHVYKRIKQI